MLGRTSPWALLLGWVLAAGCATGRGSDPEQASPPPPTEVESPPAAPVAAPVPGDEDGPRDGDALPTRAPPAPQGQADAPQPTGGAEGRPPVRPRSKSGAPRSPTGGDHPQAGPGKRYAVVIGLMSIGAGTDREARQRLRALIGAHDLSPRIVPWGPEGETDYCFALEGLAPPERGRVIAQLERIAKRPLVQMGRNTPCRAEPGPHVPRGR